MKPSMHVMDYFIAARLDFCLLFNSRLYNYMNGTLPKNAKMILVEPMHLKRTLLAFIYSRIVESCFLN